MNNTVKKYYKKLAQHFTFDDAVILGGIIGDHGVAEFFKSSGFNLADALAAHIMFLAQFFQRGGGFAQAARR